MNKAITTPELFKLLSLSIGKEKAATPYMVAKVLGVAPTTTGYWMRGYTVMDDQIALRVAEMLGLDADFVLLSLEAERKRKSNLDKIAAIFERAALAVANHGAAAAVVLALPFLISALPYLVRSSQYACILC